LGQREEEQRLDLLEHQKNHELVSSVDRATETLCMARQVQASYEGPVPYFYRSFHFFIHFIPPQNLVPRFR
jgi:hypothetical protein